MKIFVSGQIGDIENVRRTQNELVQAGHTITHDWTRNEGDKLLSSSKEKLRDIKETGRFAQMDIQGVVDCDVFIICTDNENSGKGMYAELGAALALNVATGKPKIYVIGKMNHMSVFYFHPSVIRFDSIEEVISELG